MENALPRTGNLLIYQTERGDTRVDVYLEQGNLWMTQRAIAELYQVRVPTINYHIRNILADGELDSSTIRDYLIVQTEGGATTFSGVKVRITDMVTAKNFLQLEESEALNRIVTRYLDYAEDQAKLHQVMHMRDWEQKLNGFLEFNEREVLQGKGQISMEDAQNWAKEQYRLFDERRRALETQADLKELTDAVTNIAGEKKE